MIVKTWRNGRCCAVQASAAYFLIVRTCTCQSPEIGLWFRMLRTLLGLDPLFRTAFAVFVATVALACDNPAPALDSGAASSPTSAAPSIAAERSATGAPSGSQPAAAGVPNASAKPTPPTAAASQPAKRASPCSPDGTCPDDDAGSGEGEPSKQPLPCDVAEIVKRRCQSCHAAMPVAGVPMSLMTWNDFDSAAITQPSQRVRELVAQRVHDTARPMPPNKLLPEAELKVLDAWLSAGAAPGDAALSCGGEPTQNPTDAEPPEDSTCYTLRAHAASKTTPWVVDDQHYACFYFDQPWPEGAQGVYFAPDYDDHPELVHHWIVYLDENGDQPDGFAEKCSGLHDTSPTMVAGWAPGSDNNDLPDDVGMFVSPKNKKILLEMHFYHDGSSAPIETTSGVKICTANKPRKHTATISMLGSESIAIEPKSPGMAQGTCTPQYDGEIHILRSWPHMHEIGTGMRTDIRFADGRTQTLGPWPFDFNNQVSYATPVIIHPGDTLTTTCEYFNPRDTTVVTGTSTDAEMCFNFVTAYPAGALKSLDIFGQSTSLTAQSTACLQ